MPRFQRARKPEEKEVRRAAILGAARALAREVGPIALSLNELGRRSGVSKPNIYRYFESREEILLGLLIAELEEAASDIEGALDRRADIARVAAAVTRAFLQRPLLCQLIGIVASILEHNLSVEAIAASKLRIAQLLGRIVVASRRALPWLAEEAGTWACSSIGLFIAGLWPAAHPSPAATEVMARPELHALLPDAERDLRRFIETLLTGLETIARRKSAKT